jgi:protein-tyrosine-phosphatase
MTGLLTRRSLGGLLALLAVPAGAWAACSPARVLFVCQAGTVNSPIAREQLKRRARERGVQLVVQSRGVKPEDHLTPLLAAQLRADGIDPAAEPIRALRPRDITNADIVVAFNEAAQAPGMSQARSWTMPPWANYARAKAQLTALTDALLDELAARGCPAA